MQEALRRAQLKRVEVLSGDFELLREQVGSENPALALLGPGCYQNIEHSVSRFRGFLAKTPLAVVLDNDVYATEALELRRFLSVRILPIADIAQMAQLVLDTLGNNSSSTSSKLSTGTIGIIHTKGGVGCSTIATSLAACWAENGRSVALVDLDDVSPLISDWSLATAAKRRTLSELLLEGEVPQNRVTEILSPVIGHENLFIVPQPISYGESFHFKADVIEGAPSSAVFMPSLIHALEQENDLVVLDLGRSWGISVFSALPLCKSVLFVFDEDKTSLKRSLETLRRFYRESDDPTEFDFGRWRFVKNGSTNSLVSQEQAAEFLARGELRQEAFPLSEISFSQTARDWYLSSESGQPKTLYGLAEDKIRTEIRKLAQSIFSFQFEEGTTKSGIGVKEKIKKVVSFLS
jgi:cellulose biosynthesis protein BcsQ